MHLYKLLRSFTTFEDNDLNEELNFFYEYLKSTQSKMPQEFINIKTHTVFINNNIIHDNIENGEEKRKFYNRLSVFVKKQYKLIIEIIDNIELYVDFVENITVEDFKHKDEFFEYSFNTLKLSDSLKLTNKDVNIKIKNLDIRQTALLFHYLEESGLFLKYDNGTKAYFAHYLTGHSMSNLRTDSGFGIIESIKKDREKPKDYNDLKFYNLNTLKKQVSSVIKLIDDDIKRLENKA
mgnify:CR=1 FL=1